MIGRCLRHARTGFGDFLNHPKSTCESELGILMGVHPAGFLEGWVFGDFQSPRLSPDEPSIQPIEASQPGQRWAGLRVGCISERRFVPRVLSIPGWRRRLAGFLSSAISRRSRSSPSLAERGLVRPRTMAGLRRANHRGHCLDAASFRHTPTYASGHSNGCYGWPTAVEEQLRCREPMPLVPHLATLHYH